MGIYPQPNQTKPTIINHNNNKNRNNNNVIWKGVIVAILRRGNFLSTERRLKLVKFDQNYPLDVLTVLARYEQFLFLPWRWSKWGTIGWFFHWMKPYNFAPVFFAWPLFLRLGFFYTKTFWPIHVLRQLKSKYSAETQLVVVVAVALFSLLLLIFFVFFVLSFILIVSI